MKRKHTTKHIPRQVISAHRWVSIAVHHHHHYHGFSWCNHHTLHFKTVHYLRCRRRIKRDNCSRLYTKLYHTLYIYTKPLAHTKALCQYKQAAAATESGQASYLMKCVTDPRYTASYAKNNDMHNVKTTTLLQKSEHTERLLFHRFQLRENIHHRNLRETNKHGLR